MSDMVTPQSTSAARAAILRSIRAHLAESAASDGVTGEEKAVKAGVAPGDKDYSIAFQEVAEKQKQDESRSLLEMFREQLEAVGGHCIVVRGEVEAARALNDIIVQLQTTLVPALRIALSDATLLRRMVREIAAEVAITPSAANL